MTYAERLAEFVKATGSKPGEMNRRKDYEPAGRESSGVTAPPRGEALHSEETTDNEGDAE